MGVFTFESEYSSTIPPAKLFNAYVIEANKLFPKVVPHAIKSVEFIEGDGGAGSILKLHFGEASPEFRYATHKIELVDKDNLLFNYNVIEGDILRDVVEKINFETKVVPSGDGGSIWKSKATYYTKGDFVLEEEKLKAADNKAKELFKAVQEYVLAHLDEF